MTFLINVLHVFIFFVVFILGISTFSNLTTAPDLLHISSNLLVISALCWLYWSTWQKSKEGYEGNNPSILSAPSKSQGALKFIIFGLALYQLIVVMGGLAP